MLRRSFAEFHAQRAQPGKTAALAAGQAQLAAYSSTPWHTCIKGCDRWVLTRELQPRDAKGLSSKQWELGTCVCVWVGGGGADTCDVMCVCWGEKEDLQLLCGQQQARVFSES
jgi:hypothetical protein